jgi:hypothetical protein
MAPLAGDLAQVLNVAEVIVEQALHRCVTLNPWQQNPKPLLTCISGVTPPLLMPHIVGPS